MTVIHTGLVLLALIINYIVSSSQSIPPHNGDPLCDVPQTETPDPLNSPPFPVRSRSRSPSACQRPISRSPPPSCPPLHIRCMNPPTKLPSNNGPKHDLDKLPFLRLISKENPHHIFQLRRYTFPNNPRLMLRQDQNTYGALPNQELIVLSALNGDVFAVLESPDTLAGIYFNHRSCKKRTKINIETEACSDLTPEEVNEIPVGMHYKIRKYFQVEKIPVLGSHSESPFNGHIISRVPSTESSDPPERSPSPQTGNFPSRSYTPPWPRLSTRFMNPLTKLPSNHGPAHDLDQLQFIRLTCRKKTHRIFELRRFTFPNDRRLLLRSRLNTHQAVPTQEQIVLSTSSGQVFAILESCDILIGIYSNYGGRIKRTKINIASGTFTELTPEEVDEVPVGIYNKIRKNFRIKKYLGEVPSSMNH